MAPAERTPLAAASVDLVTVARAFHWFDRDRFYAEVRRVVRAGRVLACWTYHIQTVCPEVDAVVHTLYADVLGPYWPPEIRHFEDRYRSLPFPIDEITPPPFRLVQTWDRDRLAAYMGTWSGGSVIATQRGETHSTWSERNWQALGEIRTANGKSPGICTCESEEWACRLKNAERPSFRHPLHTLKRETSSRLSASFILTAAIARAPCSRTMIRCVAHDNFAHSVTRSCR